MTIGRYQMGGGGPLHCIMTHLSLSVDVDGHEKSRWQVLFTSKRASGPAFNFAFVLYDSLREIADFV